MSTAESLTRQIQQASDIVDIVSRHVRLSRAGKDLRGLCPFHSEKTPSFYVVPAKQIYKCFGCGAGGDVFKFIQMREAVPFVEARRILAERAGISLDGATGRSGAAGQVDRAALARVNEWAAGWFARQLGTAAGEAARTYVLGRGISEQSIAQFGIGFAPESWDALMQAGRAAGYAPDVLLSAGLIKKHAERDSLYDVFRNRLMFPIRDGMTRVLGFGGRTMSNDPAKYLNTPQTVLFDKSGALYGLDQASKGIGTRGFAVVVEGYTDCVMAHQCGFANTVATLGTALTESHVSVLRRFAEAVTVVFDSDEAGQRAADRALPLFLMQRMSVRLARVPQGKDPCEFLGAAGADAFEAVLKSATDALEFKWKSLQDQFAGTEVGPARMRGVEAFLELIARAADWGAVDSIQRGLAVNQIAKLLGIARQDIDERLRHIGQHRPERETASPPPVEVPAAEELRDPVAAATRQLLEVLLNEPGWWTEARAWFDPALLPEPMRRVGAALAELADGYGEFTLAELLAQLEDVAAAQCAVMLQSAGERRGRMEESLRAALNSIQRERSRRRAAEVAADIRSAPADGGDAMNDRLRELTAAAKGHRHFLKLGARR